MPGEKSPTESNIACVGARSRAKQTGGEESEPAMADITIYLGNKNYSSWSLRPWLALKQTGAPFEEVVIPLYRADSAAALRRISPSGKVPALRHGEVLVWESLAICEYLAEAFPEAGLWPADREARAMARAVSAEMHAGFAALRQNLPMDLSRHKPQ